MISFSILRFSKIFLFSIIQLLHNIEENFSPKEKGIQIVSCKCEEEQYYINTNDFFLMIYKICIRLYSKAIMKQTLNNSN